MEKNTSVWYRDQRVPSNKELREALVPWADPDFLSTPIPMKPGAFNMTLMTDASEDAWRGILQPQKVKAAWPIEGQGISMNWKEQEAIHRSILVFQERRRGQCIRIVREYDSPSLFEERRISSFRSPIVSLHGASAF